MAKNSNTSFAYEALVSIILPEGILNVFEVVNVEEVHTGFIEETGLEHRVIHIHLDERDLRSKEGYAHRSNPWHKSLCCGGTPDEDTRGQASGSKGGDDGLLGLHVFHRDTSLPERRHRD